MIIKLTTVEGESVWFNSEYIFTMKVVEDNNEVATSIFKADGRFLTVKETPEFIADLINNQK